MEGTLPRDLNPPGPEDARKTTIKSKPPRQMIILDQLEFKFRKNVNKNV